MEREGRRFLSFNIPLSASLSKAQHFSGPGPSNEAPGQDSESQFFINEETEAGGEEAEDLGVERRCAQMVLGSGDVTMGVGPAGKEQLRWGKRP